MSGQLENRQAAFTNEIVCLCRQSLLCTTEVPWLGGGGGPLPENICIFEPPVLDFRQLPIKHCDVFYPLDKGWFGRRNVILPFFCLYFIQEGQHGTGDELALSPPLVFLLKETLWQTDQVPQSISFIRSNRRSRTFICTLLLNIYKDFEFNN
jgi:hypothetical protein